MPTGTVKWFNNAKGYGFILADEGGEDLFAHYSAIQMEGYRTLKAGQQVNFDIVRGDKGYHAANISPVSSGDSAPPARLPHPAPKRPTPKVSWRRKQRLSTNLASGSPHTQKSPSLCGEGLFYSKPDRRAQSQIRQLRPYA
ncbi:hypothetical protein GL2_37740 [Microbulbifer sp. GL-2]|nr:cold shock domain-containing protein CspD [Microbulbifer sp. GL-2]BBM03700.1 hypothetical protein GL2_37740 [Microbulbifer sp. GL-2]